MADQKKDAERIERLRQVVRDSAEVLADGIADPYTAEKLSDIVRVGGALLSQVEMAKHDRLRGIAPLGAFQQGGWTDQN